MCQLKFLWKEIIQPYGRRRTKCKYNLKIAVKSSVYHDKKAKRSSQWVYQNREQKWKGWLALYSLYSRVGTLLHPMKDCPDDEIITSGW